MATLMLTAAVLTADHGGLSGVFVAATIPTLVGTVTHRLPLLHPSAAAAGPTASTEKT